MTAPDPALDALDEGASAAVGSATEVVDHVAVARLYGEPLFALPQDLYIPPDALEVFLETFEGPLDQPAAWALPAEGECPDGFPIKVKLKSGIFHQPGGLAYERTNPDRCYRDAATAEADGFRAAKR